MRSGQRNFVLSLQNSLGVVKILYLAIDSIWSDIGFLLSIHVKLDFTQNTKKYINEIKSSLLLRETYSNAFLLENITFPLNGTSWANGKCDPFESTYFYEIPKSIKYSLLISLGSLLASPMRILSGLMSQWI